MTIKLFLVVLGATVPGRLIEQHDVVFAAANEVSELVPLLQDAWPAGSSVHIDAYREVSVVGQYRVQLSPSTPQHTDCTPAGVQLFFFNLGGYVQGDMEEHHHKALVVASSQKDASAIIKQSEFYQNRGYEGAVSHIDDKMAIDIDDVHIVGDLLVAQGWQLQLTQLDANEPEDPWHVGYLSLSKLAKSASSIEA